jgi:adenosylcobinamide-phosphate synthase
VSNAQAMVTAGALLLALWVDHIWGEPAERWQPVVWMGRYLEYAAQRFVPRQEGAPHAKRIFLLGAVYWCLGAMVFTALFAGCEYVLQQLHPALSIILMGFALKPLLAMAMLCSEVLAVELALNQSLVLGRERLSRLVSRETQDLSASQVREAAIETLSENLNDSVISPIVWFVVGGLPAAALYRFANTADAMWGYPGMRHGRDWRWAGKWAARADDVLSWPGARLTAALVWVCSGLRWSWAELGEQAGQTPSPNSGWPMAAFALALGVRLGKPGVYCLNPQAELATRAHLDAALLLTRKVLVAGVLFALSAIIFIVIL